MGTGLLLFPHLRLIWGWMLSLLAPVLTGLPLGLRPQAESPRRIKIHRKTQVPKSFKQTVHEETQPWSQSQITEEPQNHGAMVSQPCWALEEAATGASSTAHTSSASVRTGAGIQCVTIAFLRKYWVSYRIYLTESHKCHATWILSPFYRWRKLTSCISVLVLL